MNHQQPFLDIHTHRIATSNVETLIHNVRLGLESIPETGGFSIGLHPWDIESLAPAGDTFFAQLSELARHPRCVAIGEAGLDTLIPIQMQRQVEVFERHLALAKALHKPIVVHCVRAHNELLALLKRIKAATPIIMHGFNNNPQIAEQLLNKGCYLSFGHALLREKSPAREVLLRCPIHQLLLETDNANIAIQEIYLAASQLLGMDISLLKEHVWQNWEKCVEGANAEK